MSAVIQSHIDFSNLADGAVLLNGGNAVPYGTDLAAAKAAASSGALICVGPGNYSVSASLAKDGVNWHFDAGANVTFASDVSTDGIWDDGGSAMSFVVTGAGVFLRSCGEEGAGYKAILCSHSESKIAIECLDILGDNQGFVESRLISAEAGRLSVRFRDAVDSGPIQGDPKIAIFWSNGRMDVRGEYAKAADYALWSQVEATPTGDAFVTVNDFESASNPLYFSGSDATAAIWINGDTVRATSTTPAINHSGQERVYIERMGKVFGAILVSSAANLFYMNGQKVSAVRNGGSGDASLLRIEGGVSRINVLHWDSVAFTGDMLKITGGTLRLLGGGDYTSGASAKGLEITGGTATLQGMRLSTVANNASNPITKSGGTLILDDVTLVAEGTRDSITASTAQNVKVYGTSVANKAKNANVTIQVGTLTVDTNVT